MITILSLFSSTPSFHLCSCPHRAPVGWIIPRSLRLPSPTANEPGVTFGFGHERKLVRDRAVGLPRCVVRLPLYAPFLVLRGQKVFPYPSSNRSRQCKSIPGRIVALRNSSAAQLINTETTTLPPPPNDCPDGKKGNTAPPLRVASAGCNTRAVVSGKGFPCVRAVIEPLARP